MPSPTTALEIGRSALGLTNAVGVDQTLTADQTTLVVSVFNDLLEIFSTNNLAVYGASNQTFNTAASTATYTIGTGGTWNTTRPVRIHPNAYSISSSTSFPCISMTQEEYNAIPVKTQTQTWADRFMYVNTFPLGVVTLWPVPTGIIPMTFSIDTVLSSVAAAGTSISFPPGYSMVFQYKLAIMLGPRFGKKMADYPEIVAIANDSFADICRVNKRIRVMGFDPAYTGGGVPTLQSFLAGN